MPEITYMALDYNRVNLQRSPQPDRQLLRLDRWTTEAVSPSWLPLSSSPAGGGGEGEREEGACYLRDRASSSLRLLRLEMALVRPVQQFKPVRH